jgi:ubiquinone/menaquinone biosynthesis C-methylase UbiE
VPPSVEPPFKRFRLIELLRGESIYSFKELYDLIAIVFPNDNRVDYVNYGYWPDGFATKLPQPELILRTVESMTFGGDDVVLDIGSGLGQPDVDILRERGPVKRIIGINLSQRQVDFSNARFRDMSVDDVIEHRVLDAVDLAVLADEGITRVVSFEVLDEVPDPGAILEAAATVLEPGGQIAFSCVTRPVSSPPPRSLRSLVEKVFLFVARFLFGDVRIRPEREFAQHLRGAGFVDITSAGIGAAMYPFVWKQYRKRWRPLLFGSGLPKSLCLLIAVDLWGNHVLHRLGWIDFTVFFARKPTSSE